MLRFTVFLYDVEVAHAPERGGWWRPLFKQHLLIDRMRKRPSGLIVDVYMLDVGVVQKPLVLGSLGVGACHRVWWKLGQSEAWVCWLLDCVRDFLFFWLGVDKVCWAVLLSWWADCCSCEVGCWWRYVPSWPLVYVVIGLYRVRPNYELQRLLRLLLLNSVVVSVL